MLQRIQTIFLLIAVVAAIAFLFLPLAELEGDIIYGKSDMLTTIVAVASSIISLFAISQYKNRKLQMRLCVLNILFAVGLFVAALLAATQFSEYVHYEFTAGLPVVIIIAQFFARRNIKKDEDLVKSMNRMR